MKFRMIDRVLSWQPRTSIRGVKTVSFEEYSLPLRLGRAPGLPDSLLLESLFQLGNWLIVLSSDFTRMGLIVRLTSVEFRRSLRPGERMLVQADARSYREDGVLFDGVARVGNEVIASGHGCLATPVPLAEYHDPADLRVLFSEIHRPIEAAHGPA